MCQVSRGELGILGRRVDVGVEVVEGAAQTWSVCGVGKQSGGKTRS